MSTAETELPNQRPPISLPKGRITRTYSHQDRAKALALYDSTGALEKTAETLGIPLSTLSDWVNNPANHSESRSKHAQDLATKFDNAAHLFIDLAVKKSKRAAFNHLMTGAAIAVDKSQLLRGQPTSISASVMSEEERMDRLSSLVEAIRGRAPAIDHNSVTDPEPALLKPQSTEP